MWERLESLKIPERLKKESEKSVLSWGLKSIQEWKEEGKKKSF